MWKKSLERTCIFCTYWLNHNCRVKEIIFQLHQFKVSDSTKYNNTTPTLAHVKKESNSTLNHALWELQLNNIVISTVVESESQKSHVLEWSTSFRFDEVGLVRRGQFIDLVEMGIGVLIGFGDFDLH